jgi:hypothetical protein
MTELLVVEVNQIGFGYCLANECCLNMRNSLLEAFPIAGQRFVFILQGTELDQAKTKVLVGVKGVVFEHIVEAHKDLVKVLFNLKAPQVKGSLGVFSFSNFPTLVKALNRSLEHNLEVIEARYGRLIQENNFLMVSGEYSVLLKLQKELEKETTDIQIIEQLSQSLQDLF